ncbi:hypothetical protein [Bradyrhizobium sp. 153]|uniref:hypothetical protein n=1 Tax=Bradyrhizobium sp. 153 TaxID=2782627 RepID=UPI001FFC21A4|nr:hypothetical protein [Bradyrhizobium sp. 153]MCK1668666.1 hypothetical protein [Bradyrhizobium sp. 153]
MSRVFVVQQPAVFDRVLKTFVPKYDLTPAAAHGRLVYLLGPGNIFKDRMDQATKQIARVMSDYSMRDCLLAVGDPVAIAAAVMIAGKRTGGVVRLLKWDRLSASYECFSVNTNVAT